jgi:hypothetical protein
MRYRFTVTGLIVLIIVSVYSCKSNQYDVDISGIKAEVRIRRLEKDLFSIDPVSVPATVPDLRRNYKGFLQLFSYVINTGDVNDSTFTDFLVRFCTDKLNNEVYAAVNKVFPDLSDTEKKLSSAFRYYKYYFPGRNVPAVYTCISGFNNSIITGDSVLGISLDRYLGADCEYYPRLGIYKYLSDRMTPDHMIPDCIYGWGASEWDFRSAGYGADNVLTEMIHEGKLRYYQKCMLPDTPDELLLGFTTEQMKFCRNNEAQMWLYLLEHDLIFSTDQFIIRKLTGEAPFTSFFTNESPGRAAAWIGFRIVESFMARNTNVTLEELMKDTDIQGILEKAKYSPK